MGGDNAKRQANFLLAHLSILFNHLQIFILVIIDNHFLRLLTLLSLTLRDLILYIYHHIFLSTSQSFTMGWFWAEAAPATVHVPIGHPSVPANADKAPPVCSYPQPFSSVANYPPGWLPYA